MSNDDDKTPVDATPIHGTDMSAAPGYDFGYRRAWDRCAQRWAMSLRTQLLLAAVPPHEVEAIVDRVRRGTDGP